MAMDMSRFLKRFQPKLFRINYSADYKTFIQHQVLTDFQHPLSGQRKREQGRRKQEGLWWHATTSTELSKSSAVRTWCRRRLRNAFTDVLKERGFDEYGRLVDAEALQRSHRNMSDMLKGKGELRLKGSLRFHALVPCIPAKYVAVQEEMGIIVDALLDTVQSQLMPAHITATGTRPQWNTAARDSISNTNSNSYTIHTPQSQKPWLHDPEPEQQWNLDGPSQNRLPQKHSDIIRKIAGRNNRLK